MVRAARRAAGKSGRGEAQPSARQGTGSRRLESRPVFDDLSDRLRDVLGRLTGHGRITEADIDAAMREVRLALLEADVNFRVVKDFVARVRERALGQDVLESLNAGQQIIKIVHEELTAILGA